MNKTLFLVFFSFAVLTQQWALAQHEAPSQKLVYERGKVIYGTQVLRNPRQISPILLQKRDPQIQLLVHKYANNHTIANVMGVIGGALIGIPLGLAIAQKPLYTGYIVAGGGVLVGAMVVQASANKNLRLAVERYNSKIGMSLTPVIYQDNTSAGIGVALRF